MFTVHIETSVKIHDDSIWLDQSSKLRGICNEVRSLRERHWDVLILAHFEKELQAVSEALQGASISFHRYSGLDESVWAAEPGDQAPAKVFVGLAQMFCQRDTASTWGKDRRLSIIVAEHHPLRDRDERIQEAAQGLSSETNVSFHAALTDPLLVHFGSEQIGGLVRQLGMDEETCLSNSLIGTAIRRSQEKIAKLVYSEIPTLSSKDWFKYNLPNRTSGS
jgi:preprotein translocase subunit SecA